MVVAATWPEESFIASWQLLWSSFAAAFPEVSGKSPSPSILEHWNIRRFHYHKPRFPFQVFQFQGQNCLAECQSLMWFFAT